MARSIEALDIELLCHALRTMIRRYEDLAEQMGLTPEYVRRCTKHELSVLNRIEINMPETELRRTK